MKIGVISDTHIPRAAQELPKEIYAAFKGVDLILHAGDLITISVLDKLSKMARTEAVHGNMDEPEIRKALPAKKIIKAGNFTIGLFHGAGAPFRLINTVKAEFPEKVDAIVFGHSHSPVNEVRDGILFFNPGSPTDKVFARYNSYGILTVNESIKGEIIKL
jgi:putative phosphoesterase